MKAVRAERFKSSQHTVTGHASIDWLNVYTYQPSVSNTHDHYRPICVTRVHSSEGMGMSVSWLQIPFYL